MQAGVVQKQLQQALRRLGEHGAYPSPDVVEVLLQIAKRQGVSAAQVALAWVLANEAVTSVIIGARRMDQLDDNLKAIDVELSEEDLAALDSASQIPLPYPAWMESLGSDRRPGEQRRFDNDDEKS